MIIHARLGTGYGDFVNLLSYVRNCSIKYDTDASLVLHFPHSKNFVVDPQDPETVIERVNYFNDQYPETPSVSVDIEHNSTVSYRFRNMLHEWDFRHGLFNLANNSKKVPNKVVHWNSLSNTYFPGYEKDPLHKQWIDVINKLTERGYNVIEVTYRTPFSEVLHHIKTCCFGIGYDGMIHQLFKCYNKPLVVVAERKEFNEFLVPQAFVCSRDEFNLEHVDLYVSHSKQKIKYVETEYKRFLNEKGDFANHPLYNTVID